MTQLAVNSSASKRPVWTCFKRVLVSFLGGAVSGYGINEVPEFGEVGVRMWWAQGRKWSQP